MRKLIFITLVFSSLLHAKCEFEDCTSFVKNITNQFLNEFENAIFGDLKKLKEVYDFLKKMDEISNNELKVLEKLQKLAIEENLISRQMVSENAKLISLQSAANKIKITKSEALQKQAELLLLIQKITIEDAGGNLK